LRFVRPHDDRPLEGLVTACARVARLFISQRDPNGDHMSNTTTRNTKSNTKSKTPRTRKSAPKSEPRTLSSVVNTVAQANDADATKTGKRVRAYIRSHDADLRKTFSWPPEEKAHKDGNRYPAMPADCASFLIEKLARSAS
jgi:hypothetical protein